MFEPHIYSTTFYKPGNALNGKWHTLGIPLITLVVMSCYVNLYQFYSFKLSERVCAKSALVMLFLGTKVAFFTRLALELTNKRSKRKFLSDFVLIAND